MFTVNEFNASLPPSDEPATGTMRSPIRPSKPPETEPEIPEPAPTVQPNAATAPEAPNNPNSALNVLRQKMKTIADEFAEGRINRAQFNAMYKRYSEQRTIIERLLQRNPESDAWRQVMSTKGYTSFLRNHFEAQPLSYSIYAHREPKPIIMGGKAALEDNLLQPLLQAIWQMTNMPKTGVGRKQLTNGEWLILAVGEYALTAVTFSLEASTAQARLVRDLHNDFERANQAALARKWIIPERMVFPQRALIDAAL